MTEPQPQTSAPPVLTKPNLSSNGILKFINEKNSYQKPEGKKCNPYRQFGISSDAPMQFCSKNTLISQMQKFKQFNKNSSQKPQFFSQKNFITIAHGKRPVIKEENNFIKQYNKAIQQNKLAFHHKTSKISNFYDKNAWMGSRFFVMGHERSQNALELKKNQIQFHTRSARSLNLSKKRSMTPATTFRTSPYPTHESMKQLILTEKARIRTMRNSLANYHKPQQHQDQRRPQTSFQYTSSLKKLSLGQSSPKKVSLQKKPRQFEINLPQWQQKQFDVKFIQWQPERANKKTSRQRDQISPQKILGIETKRSNKFDLQN